MSREHSASGHRHWCFFSLTPYDDLDHNATNDSQGLETLVGLLPGMNFRCASGFRDIRPAGRIHRPLSFTNSQGIQTLQSNYHLDFSPHFPAVKSIIKVSRSVPFSG